MVIGEAAQPHVVPCICASLPPTLQNSPVISPRLGFFISTPICRAIVGNLLCGDPPPRQRYNGAFQNMHSIPLFLEVFQRFSQSATFHFAAIIVGKPSFPNVFPVSNFPFAAIIVEKPSFSDVFQSATFHLQQSLLANLPSPTFSSQQLSICSSHCGNFPPPSETVWCHQGMPTEANRWQGREFVLTLTRFL